MDRINWVTCDCFNAIGQLARVRDRESASPELVHGRMKKYLGLLAQRAREAGYSDQDTRLTLYAVTALADEVVMAHPGAVRDYWAARPLQLVLFAENVAGERFFEHLERVRNSAQQVDVLRVHYLCLLFGFRGRYGVRGAEVAINELIDGVRAQMQRSLALPEALSPSGTRPEEWAVRVPTRWPVLLLATSVLALAGVLYLGLAVSLREQLQGFVAWTTQSGAG